MDQTALGKRFSIRVEKDDSIGRSYSKKAKLDRSIAKSRKLLKSKSCVIEKEVVSHVTLYTIPLNSLTAEGLLTYFHNTYDLYETLFSSLNDDSIFYQVPDNLRRPLVFYLGHTSSLYINKLHLAGLVEHVNPYLEKLFETGVDEMSWDDMDVMQNEDFVWPTIQETMQFRRQTKQVVQDLICSLDLSKSITMDDATWAIPMGFEHDHIHFETSSVLIRQLPIDSVTRPSSWIYAPSNSKTPEEAPKNELIRIDGGKAKLGKPKNFPSFGWDNEYGYKEIEVPSFRAGKFLVTNAEFLPFVEGGGYREKKWWISDTGDDEGWRWLTFRNATHPSFWVATQNMPEYFGGTADYPYQKDDGHLSCGTGKIFKYRAMFDIIDMPWDWPVEVNYHEAKAFCRWKFAQDGLKYRLPTEAEFRLMRAEEMEGQNELSQDEFVNPEIDVAMRPEIPRNLNMRFGSSSPVDMFVPTKTGIYDPYGNVWQWVEDHFSPLPGSEIHYLYDDFSTPCYDGWHTMIMGGSWASVGELASLFARYHFRRHFFQHLGFRYVVTSAQETWDGSSSAVNIFETRSDVSNSIANSYLPSDKKFERIKQIDLPNAHDYHRNLAELVWRVFRKHNPACVEPSVLDIGCGVGGTCIQLTRFFSHVVGMDQSESLIRVARLMQHHGEIDFNLFEEGMLVHPEVAHVSFVAPDADRSRIVYLHSSIENLSDELKQLAPFDCIVVSDVLDKLVQPLHLIEAIRSLLKTEGVLVVSSCNDWHENSTPRMNWLGGFKMNGETFTTIDMLSRSFAPSTRLPLQMVEQCDMPRLVREHKRKFLLTINQVSVWSGLSSLSDHESTSDDSVDQINGNGDDKLAQTS